jgi:hypothetical protein
MTNLPSLSGTDYCDRNWLSPAAVGMTIGAGKTVVAWPMTVRTESCTCTVFGGRRQSGWLVDVWDLKF